MLYRDEISVDDINPNHFTVFNIEGYVVLEIPKRLVKNIKAAEALLDWLAPIMQEVQNTSFRNGRDTGMDDLRRDLCDLLGALRTREFDRLADRVDAIEANQ